MQKHRLFMQDVSIEYELMWFENERQADGSLIDDLVRRCRASLRIGAVRSFFCASRERLGLAVVFMLCGI